MTPDPIRRASGAPARALLRALVLILFAAAPAAAQTQTEPPAPATESFAEFVGVDLLLASLRDGIVAGWSDMPAGADEAAAFDAALVAFDTDRLVAEVDARLIGLITEDERRQIRGYYATEAGAAILAMEKAAFDNAAPDEELARTAEAYARYYDDPARAEVLDAMIAATRAVDFNNAFVTTIVEGITRGALLGAENGVQLGEAEIDALVDLQLEPVRAQMEPLVQGSLAHTYRDAATDALSAHLDFLRSDLGQRYMFSSFASIDGVVGDAARDFAERLAIEARKRGI